MASQQSDVSRFISSIPIVTKILIGVNVLVHIIIYLTSTNIGVFAISANSIVYNYEYYRIVSAAFVHASLMHIFFNMSSLLQMGIDLENQFGSLSFLIMSIWSVLAVGIVYITLAWSISYFTGTPNYAATSAVGYSGVLFTYAILESFHTVETSRSVFGLFNVPAKLYPFILLILLQVIIPGISFFGHLSGVLVGIAAVSGLLCFILPSSEALDAIENRCGSGFLCSNGSYIRNTGKSYALVSTANNVVLSSIYNGTIYILGLIGNVISTVLYMIGCPIGSITSSISRFRDSATGFISSLSRPAQSAAPSESVPNPLHNFTGQANRLDGSVTAPTTHRPRQQGDYLSLPTDEESGIEIRHNPQVQKSAIASNLKPVPSAPQLPRNPPNIGSLPK